MAWQPFDKLDWDSFAGCEKFDDGSEPLINYDIKIDDLEAVAIVAGGPAPTLSMEALTPDGEPVVYFYGTTAQAFAFVAKSETNPSWQTGELLELGLTEEPVR